MSEHAAMGTETTTATHADGGPESSFRAAADIGGTFTDIAVLDDQGLLLVKKVLSTPANYAEGILTGLTELLREAVWAPSSCTEVIHATTVATNAVLEGTGARAGLVTTNGFRDVLELRRIRTPRLYDLGFQPSPPLVARNLRVEVDERVAANGATVADLDEGSVVRAAERLRVEQVESVAVALIHSYRSPAHERRVGEILRRELPGVFVTLSVDVLPEIREYERTSTTVINAYVGPVVRSYMQGLSHGLVASGITGRLSIMQSSGGLMSADDVHERPAYIVESGPAAGAIAAQALAHELCLENVIAFDMGGTTAKATMIEHGSVARTTDYEIGSGISLSSRLVKGGGHAMRLPVLDIAEVGAGGGSIVSIDRGGALRVGPRSAGAVPGPACYGNGGTDPTVTDANVVLGYINPTSLAGGTLVGRPDLAREAIERVSADLGLDAERTAYAVHAVANATMTRALKAVTTYRGRDPREFALVAFGGSGPVHAASIGLGLGITTIVVPPAPGAFSALGLLVADPSYETSRTFLTRLIEADLSALNLSFLEAEQLVQRHVGRLSSGRAPQVRRYADLRYLGQTHELTVPVPDGFFGRDECQDLSEAFSQEHAITYGHRTDDVPVEIVTLRVVATIPCDRCLPKYTSPSTGQGDRTVYFGPEMGSITTPLVKRGDLLGSARPGPMIVEEEDSTTVIPVGAKASVDPNGCIIITLGVLDG